MQLLKRVIKGSVMSTFLLCYLSVWLLLHACEVALLVQVIAPILKTGIRVRELLEGSVPILGNQQEPSARLSLVRIISHGNP